MFERSCRWIKKVSYYFPRFRKFLNLALIFVSLGSRKAKTEINTNPKIVIAKSTDVEITVFGIPQLIKHKSILRMFLSILESKLKSQPKVKSFSKELTIF